MKNIIFSGALLVVLSTPVQSDDTITGIDTSTIPMEQLAANTETNQTNQPIDQPSTAAIINCNYKIPSGVKKVDATLILTWTEKATIQSFEFTPALVDTQIQQLQSCFTEQGWIGFNSALQKSGNIQAIKSQKLTVTSHIDGQAQITEAKDNQWKVTIPLQVVYQSEKEKVTQLLTVNLVIGRKIKGDLGIMQLIATPRPTQSSQQASLDVTIQTNISENEVIASTPVKNNTNNTNIDTGNTDTTTPEENTDNKPQKNETDTNQSE
jgi:hypothetical protein